ncbi:MAG: heme o synthase [Phycisphaerae bacterium]
MKPVARAAVIARPTLASRLADYLELTKPRLNALTIAATLAALYLASPGLPDPRLLVHVFLATSCVAGAASALNQVLERRRDALMERTADRPLPAGRLTPTAAAVFGLLLGAAGVVWFALVVNTLSAWLAAVTLATYLLVYTPLKTRTWLNTLAGAVPGALPLPLGWAAAGGSLDPVVGILFAIVFCWQVPHFFAIATVYKDDYAAGGFAMLPVIDTRGRSTSTMVQLFTLMLVPLAPAPFWFGLTGTVYPIVAAALGVGFMGFAVLYARRRTAQDARRLFYASIVYLPLLLIVMMLDKT